MIYGAPGTADAKIQYKDRYDNFIGGKWVPPVKGEYFGVITPISGQVYTKTARSRAEDIELALDAAHAAADAWGKTYPTERANILLKIADRLEGNLKILVYAESVDNGKPIRKTLATDIPPTVDPFLYLAGALRAQEGGISELDETSVAYHIHEPLGVIGQITPWNFPILMAAWKLAPIIGAGNCVVLKPANASPIGIMILATLVVGVLSYTKLGRSEDPSFNVPVMTAVVVWPGATTQEIQDQVTHRMERTLRELKGFDYVQTFSRQGLWCGLIAHEGRFAKSTIH